MSRSSTPRKPPPPATGADARWAGLAKRGAGFAALAALLALASWTQLTRPLDDALAEARFRLLTRPASQTLTVVEIDTRSIRAAGRWPWGRDRFAQAIENLQGAGAQTIGFDVDFSAPSQPAADARLEAAIRAKPAGVVLPTFVQPNGQAGELVESTPLGPLAAEALLASVNVPVDADGRVRRYSYSFGEGAQQRQTIAGVLGGADLARTGTFLIDYGIRAESTPRISFEDLYTGRFDPRLVAGRNVIVGATALELGDEFATPKHGTLSGVYVHALAYESLHAGRALAALSPGVLLALALLVGVLVRPRRRAVNLKALLAVHAAAAAALVAAPVAIQAAIPVSVDVGLLLLSQALCLFWTVRLELKRRAEAAVKEREAHLMELAAHMRRSRDKIRAANRKLKASNEALDKALKARTEFLASTSHEIRTPLNGILGMTQVILREPQLADPVRHKVGLVKSAGETMLALIDDILDAAKIETGNLVVAPAPMDLHRLLDETVQLWSAKADEKSLILRSDRGAVPAWISEDITRLRQIVFNLMSNAIKFTEAGEVKLSAAIDARGKHETLVLRVADTGIGVPAEKLEEIFEPFRQVDGSVTRKYGGTGLGLAIARQLAAAMGGELSVASEPGKGSVFTVRLPLRRASDPKAVASDVATGPNGGSGLARAAVLLVEGNPLARSVLRAALGDRVARLEAAASLEEAQGALRSRPFDLVLADSGALAPTGEDAAAGVATLAADAGAARISLLWGGRPDEVPQLRAAGAGHVLQKPIKAADLADELQRLWSAVDGKKRTADGARAAAQ